MRVPEFDMKHLKKAEGHIGQNVVSITIKMRSKVQIFKVITIIKLHLRNLDKYHTMTNFRSNLAGKISESIIQRPHLGFIFPTNQINGKPTTS